MIHRLAIIIGSITAAAVLALGFAATGFGPAAAPVEAEQPVVAAAAAPDVAVAKPITRVQTETIYVRPAPKPKVIHVTKRAPAATKHVKVVKVVHVTKVSTTKHGDGGGGGEREHGDD